MWDRNLNKLINSKIVHSVATDSMRSTTDWGSEMGEYTKEAVFERLKHSIQLLASPPEIQLQLLPSFVCKADELALNFDQWREVALNNYEKELSIDQISATDALDVKLDWLTDNGGQHWTDEAIRTSPEWQNVRCLALNTLRAFGWPLETPPSYAHEYKPAVQDRRHREN